MINVSVFRGLTETTRLKEDPKRAGDASFPVAGGLIGATDPVR